MTCSTGSLYLMDQGGHRVNGAVVWSGPELGHREQIEALNIIVDALGHYLLQEFAHALHERYRTVRFRGAVVGFLWFVNYHNRGPLPWMRAFP